MQYYLVSFYRKHKNLPHGKTCGRMKRSKYNTDQAVAAFVDDALDCFF